MIFINQNLNVKYIVDKIKATYLENYLDNNIEAVEAVLNDMIQLFKGKRKGFQKCDVGYHDFHHSLQTIPPFVDIIAGWNKSGNTPKISKKYFDIGIIGVLLHDTGYLKTEGDIEGTGAKYTFIHIQRSIDFAVDYLVQMGFDKNKIMSISNAILCTGISIKLEDIHFNSEEESVIAYALGTADLLGQMSAIDYPEKLPILYHEFKEGYKYSGIENLHRSGIITFSNFSDLLKNTKIFYRKTVLDRLEKMGSVYNYIPYSYGNLKNPYIDAIYKNIEKIEASI